MDNEDLRTLALFEKVEENHQINQRQLAKELGISLGLTNAFIQRVLQKGWMRARQVSARRWMYFLTPQGAMEKSRLTVNYLRRSMRYFQEIKERVNEKLQQLSGQGVKGLYLYGEGDLTEVVMLCLSLWNIKLLGTISPQHLSTSDASLSPPLPKLQKNELILITALDGIDKIRMHLQSEGYQENKDWSSF